MSQRVFSLRDVPADEAEDVFSLLDEANIAWYQTAPSVWGLSSPAVYVYDAEQAIQARALIDQYQRGRSSAARASGEPIPRGFTGFLRSLVRDWLQKPVRMTALLLVIGVVLYFSIRPFMLLS